MDFFDDATLRLKQELGLKTDKAVAEALGMSGVAWVGRKKRGNFPETELLALKAKRPDLNLDVGYVLTGRRQSGHARRAMEGLLHASASSLSDPAVAESAAAAFRKQAAEEAARAPYLQAIADRANYGTLDDLEWVIGFLDLCRTDRAAADAMKQKRSGIEAASGAVTVTGDGNVTAGRDLTTVPKPPPKRRSR